MSHGKFFLCFNDIEFPCNLNIIIVSEEVFPCRKLGGSERSLIDLFGLEQSDNKKLNYKFRTSGLIISLELVLEKISISDRHEKFGEMPCICHAVSCEGIVEDIAYNVDIDQRSVILAKKESNEIVFHIL